MATDIIIPESRPDFRTPHERFLDAVRKYQLRENGDQPTADLFTTNFREGLPTVRDHLPHQYRFALITDLIAQTSTFDLDVVPVAVGSGYSADLARQVEERQPEDESFDVYVLRRGVFTFPPAGVRIPGKYGKMSSKKVIKDTPAEIIETPSWEPLFGAIRVGFPNHQLLST